MATYDIYCEDHGQVAECTGKLGTLEYPDERDPTDALKGYLCLPCTEARAAEMMKPEPEGE